MYDDNLQTDRLTVLRNMLFDCGGLVPGEPLLIVEEPAGVGYYEDGLADAVAAGADALGLTVARRVEPVVETAQPPSDALAQAMQEAALTLFLARRGDQLRFHGLHPTFKGIVCYALEVRTLFSRFGAAPYSAVVGLRDCIDAACWAATEIRLTCPLGSDFTGRILPGSAAPKDTTTYRFPLSVHSPLPATAFSGVVVQAGFLVGTGSRYYTPYERPLAAPLRVLIDKGRILGFEGTAQDVAMAEAHYAFVADRFGLDERAVHSWHSGIHPGCAFHGPAGTDLARWSGSAFGNPRLMHLHSCGAEPPGEISLNVLDPTITLDGITLWEAGRLHPDRVPGGAEILAAHPDLAALFAAPVQACGARPQGLCFD